MSHGNLKVFLTVKHGIKLLRSYFEHNWVLFWLDGIKSRSRFSPILTWNWSYLGAPGTNLSVKLSQAEQLFLTLIMSEFFIYFPKRRPGGSNWGDTYVIFSVMRPAAYKPAVTGGWQEC